MQRSPSELSRQTPRGTERRCSKCQRWKAADLSQFYAAGRRDRLHAKCILCMRQLARDRYRARVGFKPAPRIPFTLWELMG